MARKWFDKGITYKLGHNYYLIRQVLLDGRRLVENQTSGGDDNVALSELLAAWSRGDLIFTVDGPNVRRSKPGLPATEYTVNDFRGLPPAQGEEAWRRYTLIRPYLAMSGRERGRALAQLKVARKEAWLAAQERGEVGVTAVGESRKRPPRSVVGQADSPRSIERFLRAFKQSGHDIRSLVPGADGAPGGRGGRRLQDQVEAIIAAVIEEGKQKVASSMQPAISTGDLQEMARIRVRAANNDRAGRLGREPDAQERLRVPSRDAIHARILAEGLEGILHRQRSELEAHVDEQTAPGPRPTRVYERIEIDQTPLDFIVVDDDDRLPIGRLYTTYAIDVATRYLAGWYDGFEPNNYQALMSCLLHCILPEIPGQDARTLYGTAHGKQSWGKPEAIYVDNGRCNVGQDARDACAELGIELVQLPLGKAWMKGTIERYIRAHHQSLIHKLPGTTFSNTIELGDYRPEELACITLSSWRRIRHLLMLDYYAERPHRGLKNQIPARRLEAGMLLHPPALDHDAAHVRTVLMSTDDRTIVHYGIDFACLRYQSPQLGPLRARLKHAKDKQVKIKYDQGDLGRIYVHDRFEERWITVPLTADYADYARGLSLWKHDILQRFAKENGDKPDLDGLATAKVRMQKIVEDEFRLKGGKGTRSWQARYLNKGKVPTSALLEGAMSPPTIDADPPLTAGGTPTAGDPAAASPLGLSPGKPSAARSGATPSDGGPGGDAAGAPPRAARPGGRARKKGDHPATAPAAIRATEAQTPEPEAPPPSAASNGPDQAARPRDRTGWGGGHDLPRTSRVTRYDPPRGRS